MGKGLGWWGGGEGRERAIEGGREEGREGWLG